MHYEPSGEGDNTGTFAMLPPMLEFARRKYADSDHHNWESTWIDFWQRHIGAWEQFLSGRLPDNVDVPEDQRSAMGTARQQLATVLFEHTQPNWLAVFEHLVRTDGSAATSLLLDLISFCELTGQLVLLRHLSQQAVDFLRTCNAAEELAACLGTLSNRHRALGDWEAARDAYAEALAIYRRLAQQHPAAFDSDVAMTLNNLGTVLRDLGGRPAARDAYTEALAIRRRLAQQHPAAFDPYVATTLNNLGTVFGDLGERDAARDAYTEALEIYMPLFHQWPQAFGRNFLTVLRNYTNRTEEAANDRWWQLWKRLQEDAETAGERETPAP